MDAERITHESVRSIPFRSTYVCTVRTSANPPARVIVEYMYVRTCMGRTGAKRHVNKVCD